VRVEEELERKHSGLVSEMEAMAASRSGRSQPSLGPTRHRLPRSVPVA